MYSQETQSRINRLCWAITLVCLLGPAVFFSLAGCTAPRAFADLAVGVHDAGAARPEIDLETPLGRYRLGVEDANGWYTELYSHTSSLPQHEEGRGLNAVWIGKRWYLPLGDPDAGTTGHAEYGWADDAGGCRP